MEEHFAMHVIEGGKEPERTSSEDQDGQEVENIRKIKIAIVEYDESTTGCHEVWSETPSTKMIF